MYQLRKIRNGRERGSARRIFPACFAPVFKIPRSPQFPAISRDFRSFPFRCFSMFSAVPAARTSKTRRRAKPRQGRTVFACRKRGMPLYRKQQGKIAAANFICRANAARLKPARAKARPQRYISARSRPPRFMRKQPRFAVRKKNRS